jgi:hypothetical protein
MSANPRAPANRAQVDGPRQQGRLRYELRLWFIAQLNGCLFTMVFVLAESQRQPTTELAST